MFRIIRNWFYWVPGRLKLKKITWKYKVYVWKFAKYSSLESIQKNGGRGYILAYVYGEDILPIEFSSRCGGKIIYSSYKTSCLIDSPALENGCNVSIYGYPEVFFTLGSAYRAWKGINDQRLSILKYGEWLESMKLIGNKVWAKG